MTSSSALCLVVLIACLSCSVSAATQYVKLKEYLGSQCTPSQLFVEAFTQLNICISNSSGDGTSYKYMLNASTNIVKYITYTDPNCVSANPTSAFVLNSCLAQSSGDFYYCTQYSIVDSPNPTDITGSVSVGSYYGGTCTPTSSTEPLTRFIYTASCVQYSSPSFSTFMSYSCDATQVYFATYNSSTCCASSLVSSYPQFSLGCSSLPAGTIYECKTYGTTSTTGAATTGISSTTGGSNPTPQYVKIVEYLFSGCNSPVFAINFVKLGVCINQENGVSYKYALQDSTTILFNRYTTLNCMGVPDSSLPSSVNVCVDGVEAASSIKSLVSTIGDSSLAGNVATVSQYASCGSSEPVSRFFFTPQCIPITTEGSLSSLSFECNPTHIIELFYQGSSTCTSGTGVFVSIYFLYSIGCNATTGLAAECPYFGASSTTGTATTGSGSSTTGSTPVKKYLATTQYQDAACASATSWGFIQMDTCINSGSASYIYTQLSSNTASYSIYLSANCAGVVYLSNTTSLNTCETQGTSSSAGSVSSSLPSPPSFLSGLVPVFSTLQSCQPSAPLLSQYYYDNACVQISYPGAPPTSYIVQCNSTHVYQTTYSGSLTCSAGTGISEFSYILGAVGCDASSGTAYECKFIGSASTTSTTSSPSTTAPSTTTGGGNPAQYFFTTLYSGNTCSSSQLGWYFTQADTCILNTYDNSSFSMSSTQLTYNSFASPNCNSATLLTSSPQPINQCTAINNTGMGDQSSKTIFASSALPSSSSSGNVYAIANYGSCPPPSSSLTTPKTRYIFGNQCSSYVSESYTISWRYTCNSTHVIQFSYSESATCTGAFTSYVPYSVGSCDLLGNLVECLSF